MVLVKRHIKKGNIIRLKSGAKPALTYTDYEEYAPQEWVEDGIWYVDAVEGTSVNINLLNGPYPGAYCSIIDIDDIEEILK